MRETPVVYHTAGARKSSYNSFEDEKKEFFFGGTNNAKAPKEKLKNFFMRNDSEEKVRGSQVMNDVNTEVLDSSIASSVSFKDRIKLPFLNKEREDKIEAVLQLSLGIQTLQTELLHSMQSFQKNFNDIQKTMKDDNSDMTSRFEKLEELVTSLQDTRVVAIADPSVADKKKIEDAAADEKKKKKKRDRRARRASAAMENYTPKVIPKPDDSRHIIFQAIKSDIHFKACSSEELNDITDCFASVKYTGGAIIVTEEEILDRLFVVEHGIVDAILDGEIVASVKSHATFGEFALLFGSASPSTFRARGDCKLWYLLREDFRNITSHYRRKRMELKSRFLKDVKIGEKVLGEILDDSEIDALALATGTEHFKNGDVIVQEGDQGETFYMVEEGTVDILKESTGPKPLVTLSSGNFFGEKALINDADVRQASCIATSDVKCLVLLRYDFVRILGNIQDLLNRSWKQDKEDPNLLSLNSKSHVLNKYDINVLDLDIRENLGIGSFSNVKLAFLRKDCKKYPDLIERTFALKCSSKEMLSESELMHHIQNEKKILSEIDNPFIVQFYSDFEDEHFIYFLIEAVLGIELYQLLCEEVTFPEQWCRFYSASIVHAFGEIHSRKIAYRDLKPENIMLDSCGYVKIVDFGFAKILDSGKTWTLCGTPDYFAPEVIRNEGHDWAVDYWGLGVFIFELMVGQPPFTSESEVEVYQNILSGNINFPPQMNPELKHLIKKLCTMDQSQRLGRTKGGTENVKKQLWYSGFSWESLYERQLSAPFVPTVNKEVTFASKPFRNSTNTNNRSRKAGLPLKKNSSIRERTAVVNTDNDRRFSVQFSDTVETSDINGNVQEKHIKEFSPVNLSSEPELQLPSVKRGLDGSFSEDGEFDEFSARAVLPKIRNRRRSYVFGKNRYEKQLSEFLKAQKNSMNSLEVSLPNLDDLLSGHAPSLMDGSGRLIKESLRALADDSSPCNTSKSRAFDHFYLLSVMEESLLSLTFDTSIGHNYLDPFLCKYVDLLDQFSCFNNAQSMNIDEISQSCFPSGTKVRIIPRCAIPGARRIGLIGTNAEKYMLHRFTNEDGHVTYGVSVTIREELQHPHMLKLRAIRQRRQAIIILQKFFRKSFERKNSGGLYRRIFSNLKSHSQRGLGLRRGSDPMFDKHIGSEKLRRVSAGADHENFKKLQLVREVLITENAKALAKESYEAMIDNDKLGDTCVVEKCFVFVGICPEEQSLLLCALKQLVELEGLLISHSDKDIIEKGLPKARRKLSQLLLTQPKTVSNNAGSQKNTDIVKEKRHKVLKTIQLELRLSSEEAKIQYPKTEIEHVRRKVPSFEHNSLHEELSGISLPLPLPRMSSEYGIATLLLRIKSYGLLAIINLLLIERSVLIIGTNPGEVSSCSCALLDLLKPYKWASAFVPMIPGNMLDFVSSPVPFIAGACADKEIGLKAIENDIRVINAIFDGMSVINLNTKEIIITKESGIKDCVMNSHGVIHQRLACYQKRLQCLAEVPSSALLSFTSYFQQGASPYESLTIKSLRNDIHHHLAGLFQQFTQDPEEWKKYGLYDQTTRSFEFFPHMLVTPLQHNTQLQEMMAHTQLFIGFVENVKSTYVDCLFIKNTKDAKAALFIADWLFFRWKQFKKKEALNYLEAFSKFGLRRWSGYCKTDTQAFLDWDSSLSGGW